jgi:hypothetical protein
MLNLLVHHVTSKLLKVNAWIQLFLTLSNPNTYHKSQFNRNAAKITAKLSHRYTSSPSQILKEMYRNKANMQSVKHNIHILNSSKNSYMFQLQQIAITGMYTRETKKLNLELKFISHPKLHIIMILMG